MRHTFTRTHPYQSALRIPYRAYQKLVGEQWHDVSPIPPDTALPPEIAHIQRIRPLARPWGTSQAAETKNTPRNRDKILAAAGRLGLELVERVRWLAEQGETIRDHDTVVHGRKTHNSLRAAIPLTVGEDFSHVSATIGLAGGYTQGPGKKSTVHLSDISIEVSGLHTTEGKFWNYASIGSSLLDAAYPRPDSILTSISPASLIEAFELRDMLTFVENNAPDALLLPQPYDRHIARGSLPVAPTA